MANDISQEDFAVLATDALVKSGVDEGSLSLDQARYSLVVKDGLGRPLKTIYLANFFDRYTSASGDESAQAKILSQIVGLTAQLDFPRDFEEARPHLRIQVKERWFFEDDKYTRIDFGEHFSATLAYDMPDNILYVDNDILECWNVSFDDAFSIAHRQLAQLTEFAFDTYRSDVNKSDCCHFFSSSDSYSSARAVFTNIMADLPVIGDTLVMVPHRDHLFITGSECNFGLRHCLSAIKELQGQPGSLPPILLKLVDEYYFPYTLPEEHPLRNQFRSLELEYLNRLYGAQKADLDARFEHITGKRFVSKYKYCDDRINPFSTSFISKDLLPCLLPKADYIFFGEGEEPEAICSWATAVAILKDKLKEINCYPKRYEVTEYPTDGEIYDMGFETLPE
ncbi:MAG TPA: hypothetical protein EYN91_20855 [Candidatus Melainabacteria bacterium]|jgi:hypothetical protein|nr:hypothetical protein [Candidatus Melainabacteria bacterium]HIN65312.1 hypothetical protein [Candidatus Obscuribacterales bacterium]